MRKSSMEQQLEAMAQIEAVQGCAQILTTRLIFVLILR